MNNERYNQIIDEAHKNYLNETLCTSDTTCLQSLLGMNLKTGEIGTIFRQYDKEEFIDKCKTDQEFSEKWGLKIVEDYELVPQTECLGDVTFTKPVRKHKTYLVYNNKVYEFYE
jgi:hypothetical protein